MMQESSAVATSNTHHGVNCFGFCCDFRKDVIAVNGTVMGVQIVNMIMLAKQAMEYPELEGVVGFWEVLLFISVIFLRTNTIDNLSR